MKEEALKLADEMIDVTDCESSEFYRAGLMIRRLVEELDKQKETIRNLNKTLGFINSGYEVINLEPQTWHMVNKDGYVKPLSDEEIGDILFKYGEKDEWFNFARAIEERHGIK